MVQCQAPPVFPVCFWSGRVGWRLQTVQLSEGHRFDPSYSRCAHVEPASLRDVAPASPLCWNSCMSQKVDPLRFTIIQLKAETAAVHGYNTNSAAWSLKGDVALLLLTSPRSSCCPTAHKQHKAPCHSFSFCPTFFSFIDIFINKSWSSSDFRSWLCRFEAWLKWQHVLTSSGCGVNFLQQIKTTSVTVIQHTFFSRFGVFGFSNNTSWTEEFKVISFWKVATTVLCLCQPPG